MLKIDRGMGPAITIERLTKDFGSVRALNGLTLEVEQGEVLGFLGPNGAGKSTTIRVLLDLIRATAGRAAILGLDTRRDAKAVHACTGYLPGELHLFPTLTGRAHVDLVASLRGIRDTKSVDAVAVELGLDLERQAGTYSKGNRQKLGIVMALVGDPPVLLLDEPTSGLDPIVQHAAWEIFERRAAQGATIFFSSHVLSEVEQICQRVAVLRGGQLVTVEPLVEWRARQRRRMEVTFQAPLPPPGTFDVPGVREVGREQATIEFEIGDDIDGLVKALAAYHVVDLRTRQPTLEELLLGLYAAGGKR